MRSLEQWNKVTQKYGILIYKTLTKVNNDPSGENLPNLVTLMQEQCDQIGRIFACWAFVFFGPCFLFAKIAKFLGYFCPWEKVTF
jgi:hypothetical protein